MLYYVKIKFVDKIIDGQNGYVQATEFNIMSSVPDSVHLNVPVDLKPLEDNPAAYQYYLYTKCNANKYQIINAIRSLKDEQSNQISSNDPYEHVFFTKYISSQRSKNIIIDRFKSLLEILKKRHRTPCINCHALTFFFKNKIYKLLGSNADQVVIETNNQLKVSSQP